MRAFRSFGATAAAATVATANAGRAPTREARRAVTFDTRQAKSPYDLPRLSQTVEDKPTDWRRAASQGMVRPFRPAGPDRPRTEEQRSRVAGWAPVVKAVADQRLRVALLGRTNTGKSSLFNALVADPIPRKQLVHDSHGVTRDSVEAPAFLEDMWITLIDTPGACDGSIVEEAKRTVETADVAVLVTSIEGAPTDEERQVAAYLRAKNIPVLLACNKMDQLFDHGPEAAAQRDALLREYLPLGCGAALPLSVRQRQGLDGLAAAIRPLHHLSLMAQTTDDWDLEDLALSGNEGAMETIRERNTTDHHIRVAIIGRPNGGKSSLFNRLLGFERTRSADDPLTTRDPVEVSCFFKGKRLKIIDTAGMGRLKTVRGSPVRESLNQATRHALRWAHVAVVVFDAMEGYPSATDMSFIHFAADEGRPFVLAANKWDRVLDPGATAEAIDYKLKRQVHEVKYANAVVCSAVTGQNLTLLLDEVLQVYENWNRHVRTRDLTRFWRRLEKSVVIPSDVTRIKRVKQTKTRPPTFVLQLQTKSDDALLKSLHVDLLRNALAEEYGFKGTPIRVIQQVRTNHPDLV